MEKGNVQIASASLFEVIAQESLKNTMRKAFRYLIEYSSSQSNRQWLKSTDELLLIIDTIMEYTHLKAFNGSFSEHFYNLRRVTSNTHPSDSALTATDVYSSLAMLALVPYIKSKLDNLYEKLHYKTEKTHRDILIMKSYRFLTSGSSMLNLVYFLRYAAGKTSYYDPLLATTSTKLVNNSSYSHSIVEDDNRSSTIMGKLAFTFNRGLTMGAILIQFLDYWYSRDDVVPEFAPMPTPPPPPNPPITFEGSLDSCPICGMKRRNECALSTTGFVFCYGCLHEHLIRHGTCPVTGFPSSEENIIRLFPPSNQAINEASNH